MKNELRNEMKSEIKNDLKNELNNNFLVVNEPDFERFKRTNQAFSLNFYSVVPIIGA
jgi:hypothetical protein